MSKKLVAEGRAVKWSGGNAENPSTVYFEMKDTESKLFEKEEVLLSSQVFLEHLMKAFNCSTAGHLRGIKVTMIFEE